jgi:hypothetical protein
MVDGARGHDVWGVEEGNQGMDELRHGWGTLFIGSKAGEAVGRGSEAVAGECLIKILEMERHRGNGKWRRQRRDRKVRQHGRLGGGGWRGATWRRHWLLEEDEAELAVGPGGPQSRVGGVLQSQLGHEKNEKE